MASVRTPKLETSAPGQSGREGASVRIGGMVGRYVLQRRVGEGGMGVVYAAYDPELDRRVALKLLWPGTPTGRDRTSRLRREAQAMAQLSHPNVVQVFDVGAIEDQVFVAMEFVDGVSLDRWLADVSPSWRAVVEVFAAAGGGLAAAHDAGLVHRDFKPANVLIGAGAGLTRRVLVGDFGLARLVADDPLTPELATDGAGTVGGEPKPHTMPSAGGALTRTGVLMGTPIYMAPEQHVGRRASPAADQYAFCASLYEALYGRRAFAGTDVRDLALAKTHASVTFPVGSDVPRWLEHLVRRGLCASPDARFESMAALLTALQGPRRRRWYGLAAATGAAALAIGVAAASRADRGCGEGHAELAGVWDADVRAEVGRTILATDVPYAGDAWAATAQMLDGFADGWQQTYERTCAAAHGAQFDLRMICLRERRAALRALVDVLRDADAAVVQRAVPAASELAPPAACVELGPGHGSDGPRAREAAVNVREQLLRAGALRDAGRPASGLEVAEAAAGMAASLGIDAVVADAQATLGSLLRDAGRPAEAEIALERGYWVAREVGEDAVAARAARALVDVCGYQLARFDDALAWWRHADAATQRVGGGPVPALKLAQTLGAVYMKHGRYADAYAQFERARAGFSALAPEQELPLAATYQSLGSVAVLRGDHEQARAHYRRALELRKQALGADHPALAAALGGLGTAFYQEGHYVEARPHYVRALELREASLPDGHPEIAIALNNLGITLNRLGQYERARELHRRALSIREAAFDGDHPTIAESLNNLGVLHQEKNEFDQARPYFERALGILERRVGPTHPDLVLPLNNLGILARFQGRLDDALRYHTRARGLAREAFGESHLHVALVELELGQVYLAQDSTGQAIEMLERANAALTHEDVDQGRRGECRFALARALRLTGGDGVRAHGLAQLAREDAVGAGARRANDVATIDAWLREHAP